MLKKTEKYKIFIFHPYSSFGGADKSLSKLIKFLQTKKRYDISFISLNSSVINLYLKKKIKIHILRKSRTIFTILELRRLVKKHNYSKYKKIIFISNQNYANIVTILALGKIKNIKKIAIERTPLHELDTFEDFKKFFKSKIIKFLMKLCYKKFDKVVCISKNIQNNLKKFTNKNITTIYNPSFNNSKISRKINLKKPLILNVGRLEKSKDQITLLRAINLIKNKVSFNLLIIGSGSQKKKLKSYISTNKLNHIVKIIKTQNVKYYYKRASIFVLSSKYEGFGNVIIEAAAFKIPIISSRCGGPEEILKNGKFGDIFAPQDYITLSKKILNNLKSKSKKFIPRHELKKYSPRNSNAKYEKIFKEI